MPSAGVTWPGITKKEVLPDKIYQVRGFDLSNITFIKGDTGWIVFDPLTAKETAAAALKLTNEQLGARPVVAVVYSYSHADHFGGVRGAVEEVDAGDQAGETVKSEMNPFEQEAPGRSDWG